jgi:hypothetical protein
MKRMAAAVLALILTLATLSFGKNIKEPKGFDAKVFHASMAMYDTSEIAGITDPKFICSVTAYKKVDKGYLVIGAGHCTSENPELPPDMKYYAAEDIGKPVMPMQLIMAEMGTTESGIYYDYAIYFLPSRYAMSKGSVDCKPSVIPLGDERDLRVGDKTVDVNFSLGVAKMTSPGVIVSQETPSPQLPQGFFLVQQFDSHGASGSAVVSEKTHKIIGLVIAGWDGATMPSAVEGISHIDERLEKLHVVFNGKDLRMSVQETVTVDVL